jgi:hypothetical protein
VEKTMSISFSPKTHLEKPRLSPPKRTTIKSKIHGASSGIAVKSTAFTI